MRVFNIIGWNLVKNKQACYSSHSKAIHKNLVKVAIYLLNEWHR